MMKKIMFVFLLMLLVLVSCKKTENKELDRDISNKSIFSSALEREILKMIEIKNREVKDTNSKLKVCNVVVLPDISRDGICVVMISLNQGIIVKKMIQFIPPSDTLDTHIDSNANLVNGYTFLGEELISCCLVSESCNNNLINEKELIPVSDSIPGYPDILNADLDGNYDTPMRIYKIVNADSLQLIKSAWIP